MNGWGGAEPAWWLNLQAHPDVTVDLADGTRQVIGRAARGDERERLWARWQRSTSISMRTPRAVPWRPQL